MRFSGISSPWGVCFYSDNYKSEIYKGKLKVTRASKYVKHEFYIYLAVLFLADIIVNFRNVIQSYFAPIINGITYSETLLPVTIDIKYIFPVWYNTLIVLLGWTIIIGINLFFLWYLISARGYHGAEHKMIYAKQTNSEYRTAPITTPRCGTNLMFPYIVIIILLYIALGLMLPGTSMLISFVLYFKLNLFRRHLSSIGSLVQKITTRPPTSKELNDAKRGIDSLVRAEETRLGRRIRPALHNLFE